VTAWDPGHSLDALARVESAVGVLMELCGWEAEAARTRLVSAAVIVDLPVTTVAEAILALGAQHPSR
jgi:AmiR/NasT family two-component response regulator